ncbi:MAG: hypothetical protein QXJ14_02065 [Candidatus Aenigmatarchaeota archaeon]
MEFELKREKSITLLEAMKNVKNGKGMLVFRKRIERFAPIVSYFEFGDENEFRRKKTI